MRPSPVSGDGLTAVQPGIPLRVRVELGHAAAQAVAGDVGADVLHVKGAGLDPSLTWKDREGTDADLVVRPAHVDRLVEGLRAAGFEPVDTFRTSSPFEHSVTLVHSVWGPVDVHRHVPGFGVPPDTAFETLWSDHTTRLIAAYPCPVPDIAGQVLVLLLHAARSGGSMRSSRDVTAAWGGIGEDVQARVEAMAAHLDARMPLAIALTRDVTPFRRRRDYDLWQLAAHGGTRAAEWRARIKAAPTARARATLVLRTPLPNPDALAFRLGHRPDAREIAVEFVSRLRRGVTEELRARRPGSRRT